MLEIDYFCSRVTAYHFDARAAATTNIERMDLAPTDRRDLAPTDRKGVIRLTPTKGGDLAPTDRKE